MITATATMIVDESQLAAGRAKTARTNNGGGVGRGSNDGCCDNVGSRARDLLDKVPPCTGKSPDQGCKRYLYESNVYLSNGV